MPTDECLNCGKISNTFRFGRCAECRKRGLNTPQDIAFKMNKAKMDRLAETKLLSDRIKRMGGI